MNPSVPVKTVPELIAYAKANPACHQYARVRVRARYGLLLWLLSFVEVGMTTNEPFADTDTSHPA